MGETVADVCSMGKQKQGKPNPTKPSPAMRVAKKKKTKIRRSQSQSQNNPEDWEAKEGDAEDQPLDQPREWSATDYQGQKRSNTEIDRGKGERTGNTRGRLLFV